MSPAPRIRVPAVILLASWLSWLAPGASASVLLSLDDPTSGQHSITVTRGQPINVNLDLVSYSTGVSDPAGQVTGLDYFLLSSANNSLTLTSRDTSTSSFTDPYATDPSVAGTPLATTSTLDLGASTATLNPVTNGTFLVAKYVLTVLPTAALTTYTVSTSSPAGYAGPGPYFDPAPFTSQAAYTITVVVPEPTGLVLLSVVGGAAWCLRRRGTR